MQSKNIISATPKLGQREVKDSKIPEQENKPGPFSTDSAGDTNAAWLESLSNVASSACKDKTPNEIFRQIGGELGKMGVSSVFL